MRKELGRPDTNNIDQRQSWPVEPAHTGYLLPRSRTGRPGLSARQVSPKKTTDLHIFPPFL